MRRETSYIETDANTQIYYQEQGGGNTVLLFIHGWAINSSYWDSQLNFFSKEYRAIAFDLPGFGKSKSGREQWTRQNYGVDGINFINKLNLKNVILVGHSMSGDVIMEAALKNHKSISGIIGIDNFKTIDVTFTEEQEKEYEGFFKALVNDFKKTVPYFAESLFHPSTDKSIRDRVINDFVTSDVKVSMAAIYDMFEYFRIQAEKLSGLNYKLYLINSDYGPTNTAGLDKYCRKSYEVEYIHDTGHYPMIEKPGEFNMILNRAIKKIV
ncbi:MAG: alpha/beta hydrolase [Spirochaetes bacterium]|nr:alpha/beta hydrolase [Spirochaetota bacterium]